MVSKTVCAALLGGCAILGAAPSVAFEPANDAQTLLVGWLEESGCAMTQKDFMGKMMAGAGVSGADMMAARRALTKSGVILRGEGNSMTLTAGDACSGTEAAAPSFTPGSDEEKYAKAMVATFEDSGCFLGERDVKSLMQDEGYTRDQIDIAGEALEDKGGFREGEDNTLSLTFGACKDATPGSLADSPVGKRVMALFEANKCALDEDRIGALAKPAGITEAQLDLVIETMADTGEIVEKEDSFTLKKGLVCGSNSASEATMADTPEAASVLLIALAERNDCKLTEDLVNLFFEENDGKFSPSSLDDAFDLLEDNGSIVINDDRASATLQTGSVCAPGNAKAPNSADSSDKRAIAIKVFEENNCRLSKAEAAEKFPAAGLSLDTDRRVVRDMIDEGLVELDPETRDAVLVTGPTCSDGEDDDEANVAPVVSDGDKKAAMIKLFEENDCRMTESLAEDLFPGIGMSIDSEDDMAMLEAMFDSGDLVENSDDSVTLVTGKVCSQKRKAKTGTITSMIYDAFAASDCTLTEGEFETALAGSGVDVDAAGEAVEDLIDAGSVTYDRTTKEATLLIGPCGG